MTLLSALMLAAAGEELPSHGDRPHSHTHAPGEIDDAHGPLLLQLTYVGETMGNVAGGRRRGVRYLDNLDMVLEADLEAIAGWSGGQLHIYGLYNNGRSISDLVGDAQAISNIETGVPALRLHEAWIDQSIADGLSLRAGLYDLNSEFDAIDAAGLFVSSPNGIGTDVAQSGRGGPSIFPSTALALRLAVKPAGGWTVRAAVLDGVPGDLARPGRTAIKLGGDDGALLVGELQAPLADGKLLVGHWRYTAAFDRNDGVGRGTGNSGYYLRAERPLARSDDRRVDGFVRLGSARGKYNMFDRFIGAGLIFGGWIPGRADDEFGIALSSAFTSRSYRAAMDAERFEIAVEATYRAPLASWLSVQPSAHYVRSPSADRGIADAFTLGVRAEVSFSFAGF